MVISNWKYVYVFEKKVIIIIDYDNFNYVVYVLV